MGEGIARPIGAVGIGAPIRSLPAFDRRAVEERAGRYLHALGVQRDAEAGVLLQRVVKRVELRAALGQLGDPFEAAVEEVHSLLDQWLVSELGLERDPDAFSAARAAVLGGDVPGWTSRWAGLSNEPLAERIRAERVLAVPERAPLRMEPTRIELCCYRLGRRLLLRIARWLGWRGRHATPAG
ncbi:hypothetical protein [Thiorhodococcus minor]|uniref:hypothetical protein n=1 Tax=Thiorhodococcus minor TaxID=57489 RepID=UPI001FD7D431|nr:hypothetical protein [Thiorhodococcus minor]